jgi:hypothetical protein
VVYSSIVEVNRKKPGFTFLGPRRSIEFIQGILSTRSIGHRMNYFESEDMVSVMVTDNIGFTDAMSILERAFNNGRCVLLSVWEKENDS